MTPRAGRDTLFAVDDAAIAALRSLLQPMDMPTRILFLMLVAGVGATLAHGEIVVEMNNRTPKRVRFTDDRLFASEQIAKLKALAAPLGV